MKPGILRTVSLVGVLAFGAVACSSDSDESPSDDAPTDSPAESPEETEAPAAT
jgi:hypothetical protein